MDKASVVLVHRRKGRRTNGILSPPQSPGRQRRTYKSGFPRKVLEKILNEVFNWRGTAYQRNLAACALVNRQWNRLATPLLYSHLFLFLDGSSKSLLGRVNKCNHTGTHLRSITFNVNACAFWSEFDKDDLSDMVAEGKISDLKRLFPAVNPTREASFARVVTKVIPQTHDLRTFYFGTLHSIMPDSSLPMFQALASTKTLTSLFLGGAIGLTSTIAPVQAGTYQDGRVNRELKRLEIIKEMPQLKILHFIAMTCSKFKKLTQRYVQVLADILRHLPLLRKLQVQVDEASTNVLFGNGSFRWSMLEALKLTGICIDSPSFDSFLKKHTGIRVIELSNVSIRSDPDFSPSPSQKPGVIQRLAAWTDGLPEEVIPHVYWQMDFENGKEGRPFLRMVRVDTVLWPLDFLEFCDAVTHERVSFFSAMVTKFTPKMALACGKMPHLSHLLLACREGKAGSEDKELAAALWKGCKRVEKMLMLEEENTGEQDIPDAELLLKYAKLYGQGMRKLHTLNMNLGEATISRNDSGDVIAIKATKQKGYVNDKPRVSRSDHFDHVYGKV